MSSIIAKPLDWIKRLFLLVFPMFGSAEAARAGDPAARWLGRIVVVGVFLGILAAINQWPVLGLWNVLGPSWVSKFWLPLLALCLYAMLWLGWWLYRLLNLDIEPVGSDYPEIDRAWAQAMDAMGKADIALDNAPLFVVMGWPSVSDDDFFRAAGIKGPVKQVPGEPEAPLHVTANRDGIWLTIPGASLLGQYREGAAAGAGVAMEEVMATMAEDSGDPYKTMGMSAGAAATLRIEDFQATFKQAQERTRVARPKRVADPESHLARLRHLCRLIIRDRRGFCPINGVLLAFPFGIDARPDLTDIADACRKDMGAMFETFRMRCPVLGMVCGLEQVGGFSELIERLPGEQARKRMGQRFPLVPDLTAGEVPDKVQEAIEVVSGNVFPSMVHAMFQVESQGLEDVDEVLRSNSQLFRFLHGIVERGERMARLVRDCIPTLRGEPLMFGGCYFAGTGRDGATEQAFASGVLMRMIKEDQDSVTWTEEALAQDATAARLVGRVRLAFIVLITLGVLAAAALIAQRFTSARPANADAAASKDE